MGVCVIERFFCTGVRNTHQKGLRMRGFRGKLFVRQKLVPTGSPVRRHPARRSDGRDLRTTYIPRDKTVSILPIGNPLWRTTVWEFVVLRTITFFVCFISVNDSEEFIRGSDWTGKSTDMQCSVYQREFSRRDNMLHHQSNIHEGGSRRGEGGRGSIGGGGGRSWGVEAEEVKRGNQSFGNPFSFVIRSWQTLRDRPIADRRISLKCCKKTVGARCRHRHRESSGCTKDGNPSTMR